MAVVFNRVGGGGGEYPSVLFTSSSFTSSGSVTMTGEGKTYNGVWVNHQRQNPEWKGLPSGYKQLSYIESTGTQWINTGYAMPSSFEISVRSKLSSIVNGALVGSNVDTALLLVYSTYYNVLASNIDGNSNSGGINYNTSDIVDVSFSPSKLYSSSGTDKTLVRSHNGGEVLYLLYSVNWPYGQYLLYSFQLSSNSVLLMNLVPAKRTSDSVIGMYDMVSGTFFTNQGTGTFTAGAEVPQYITTQGFLCRGIKDFGSYSYIATQGSSTKAGTILIDAVEDYTVSIPLGYLLLTTTDFDSATRVSRTNSFTYANLTNQVDGSDGFTITGRNLEYASSNSYVCTRGTMSMAIDLTPYSSFSFYSKKVNNHGCLFVSISDSIPTASTVYSDVNVIESILYPSFPTEYTKYEFDISSYTGVKYVNFGGGYVDSSGYTSSCTAYCKILFVE